MYYVVETFTMRDIGPGFVTRHVAVAGDVIAKADSIGDALKTQRATPGTRVREVWSMAEYRDAAAHERNRGA
jgi:hypothetical protein